MDRADGRHTMNGFVPHCGRCGHALPCACQAVAMQVPPPIVAPALPTRKFVKWGGYMICEHCRMAQEWCGCAKAPPPPPTQGDGADSDLNRRIRALKGGP